MCSDACWERFCEHCNGPKTAEVGPYTNHQMREAMKANNVREEAYRMRARLRYRVYEERAQELIDADPTRWPRPRAVDVYAGLNGLCCR